jgi:hypothetical protein
MRLRTAANWHRVGTSVSCSVTANRAILPGVATLAQKIEAEARMRDLLEEHDMPQPDRVEYGFGCIRLFFERTKHVVVIDIDEPANG